MCFLHFTDAISCNFSVTMNPYSQMKPGVDVLERTIIMKLLGRASTTENVLLQVKPPNYVNYQVQEGGTFLNEKIIITSSHIWSHYRAGKYQKLLLRESPCFDWNLARIVTIHSTVKPILSYVFSYLEHCSSHSLQFTHLPKQ